MPHPLSNSVLIVFVLVRGFHCNPFAISVSWCSQSNLISGQYGRKVLGAVCWQSDATALLPTGNAVFCEDDKLSTRKRDKESLLVCRQHLCFHGHSCSVEPCPWHKASAFSIFLKICPKRSEMRKLPLVSSYTGDYMHLMDKAALHFSMYPHTHTVGSLESGEQGILLILGLL